MFEEKISVNKLDSQNKPIEYLKIIKQNLEKDKQFNLQGTMINGALAYTDNDLRDNPTILLKYSEYDDYVFVCRLNNKSNLKKYTKDMSSRKVRGSINNFSKGARIFAKVKRTENNNFEDIKANSFNDFYCLQGQNKKYKYIHINIVRILDIRPDFIFENRIIF